MSMLLRKGSFLLVQTNQYLSTWMLLPKKTPVVQSTLALKTDEEVVDCFEDILVTQQCWMMRMTHMDTSNYFNWMYCIAGFFCTAKFPFFRRKFGFVHFLFVLTSTTQTTCILILQLCAFNFCVWRLENEKNESLIWPNETNLLCGNEHRT